MDMWTQVEQIMEEPTSRIVQRIAALSLEP